MNSGRLSAQYNSIYNHSSDRSLSAESFYLQMKVQAIQANDKNPSPKHLFTNLEFKVKPHKNKTKFLWATIDTCADVNIIPVNIYKYLFKDPDFPRLHQVICSWEHTPTRRSRFWDLATYILYIQIQDVSQKYHFCGQQWRQYLDLNAQTVLAWLSYMWSWTIHPQRAMLFLMVLRR